MLLSVQWYLAGFHRTMTRLSTLIFCACSLLFEPSYQQTPQCGRVIPDPPGVSGGTGGDETGVIGRVMGGADAPKRTWPWQVSLQKDGRHWCGGVLIDRTHVLTVAHRVQDTRDPARYKVVLALNDLFKMPKATVMNVVNITVHPQFSRFTNNIAILTLSSPVQFQSKINAVCLPESAAQAGAECVTTGWGERRNTDDLSAKNILQQATVPIVASSTCKQAAYWGEMVDDTMLCAGGRGVDSCFGDGGGPLVCKDTTGKWELQGLVSWGARECGVENKPGVYTNVMAMKAWILANIGGAGTDGPLPPAPPVPTSLDPTGRDGNSAVPAPFDSSEEQG